MSTPFKESLDREDAPFLAAAAAAAAADVASDSNVHRTNAAHKHNEDGDEGMDPLHHHDDEEEDEDVKLLNKKIRFRLMVTLFAMILAVEVGICMSNGPVTRIFESIACREYYAQYDPTQIGANGQVDEDLCKIKEVQQDLAAVKGYMEFFDGTLSAILAIPYGLMADRLGRKSTICLSIPGFVLNCLMQLAVMWFPDTFPLRTVWASSLAWLLGGGPVVAFAIIWTMMSDVSTEEERAASSWLMALDPWLPLLLGWALAIIGMFFALSLPETMGASPGRGSKKSNNLELGQIFSSHAEYKSVPSKEQEQEVSSDDEDSAPGESHVDEKNGAATATATRRTVFAAVKRRVQAYFAPYAFIVQNRQIMLLLTAFLVYRLSRGSSWFLVQYISTRFKWTLAEANFLMSFKPALTIPLFLFVLPAISRRLLKSMKPTQKDLTLMRISIVFLAVGTLGIGLSSHVYMLIPSLLLQTSGSGFVFLTRSLITTLVRREETARLFTIIEVLQSMGNVIASLSITTVFQIGLELGGPWIGLAWMMTATAFMMTRHTAGNVLAHGQIGDHTTSSITHHAPPSLLLLNHGEIHSIPRSRSAFRTCLGSGIAPFLPIPPQPISYLQIPVRIVLFWIRLPLFVFACLSYFLVLQWLPIGSLGKKASLWCILGIPSIWWIDLQVDGVRKGSLHRQDQTRLPGPRSIIASSFTSPIDPLYLAAIFDPIFTACYPNTSEVEQISLFQAILRAFGAPQPTAPAARKLTTLDALLRKYPGRALVTFPECTTTNGRAILPLSPALLAVPPATKIYPISLRYTPVDVVTPLPGSYLSFLWNLLSKPTHCIRVRIAGGVTPTATTTTTASAASTGSSTRRTNYDTNYLDTLDASTRSASSSPEATAVSDAALLDHVADSLARLGRVKRVGLGVKEKVDFVRVWTRGRWVW
ncbi:MFS general substrate transporter [Aspergillus uvarum CBS 121591]|uniref:MFS general substrate transporter n=1 Tax=Aspergillus uvarum CBS 121591 TaxID=1448315 RepID=A0A319CE42_9EURO|nr:MFS general substrate transporter [Aspergillus uvarum CBS 121591]PYH82499.1 MFS general substrate transporter [Aspergillus uvarum CBS 121591]